jgi:predicted Zn-dependent protease
MIRRVLLALAVSLPLLALLPRPAAAQSPDSCTPNYARISRMQGLLHWNHFPLRIAIASPPDSVQDKDAYTQAVLAGFTQWVDASHGKISYTVVAQPQQADLTVSFGPEATIPGQGTAVGYTSMLFSGTALRCADMRLATGGATPGDLQTVAAHEFGHALGIDGHSDDPDDIMYPSTLRMSSENGVPLAPPLHPITARDLNTLKVCYPALFTLHLAARPVPVIGHGRIGAALLGTHRTDAHVPAARRRMHG